MVTLTFHDNTVALPSPGEVLSMAINLTREIVVSGCARDGPLKNHIAAGLSKWRELSESLPLGSPQQLYMNTLQTTVETLVGTLVAWIDGYSHNVDVEDKEMDARSGNLSEAERFSCILSAELKLLVMCKESIFFVSFLITALFAAGIPVFETPVSGDSTWRSIAGILALTFLGVCGRKYIVDRRNLKNMKMHKKRLNGAGIDFCSCIEKLHDYAVDVCSNCLSDLKAVSGNGFHASSDEPMKTDLFVDAVFGMANRSRLCPELSPRHRKGGGP